MENLIKAFWGGLFSLFLCLTVHAGDTMATTQLKKPIVTDTSLFQEDIIEFQGISGASFSPVLGASDRPTFNYAPTILRFGWMLNTPEGDSFYRGNFEALADLYTAGIFDGAGGLIIGPTALVRYNFVQPGWKFVPYIQGGAGIVYTDAYKNHGQSLIGQAFEFTPQASVGVRYMIDNNWSINLEGMFHHISNANLASRNVGVNSVGAFLGVSYLFDRKH